MVYIFYNKVLLRALVLLAGVGIALATYHYVSLSVAELPEEGLRDALSIMSFLIAAWLVMVIAEVIDNHYARVFGTLCVLLGAFVAYKWIAQDEPALMGVSGAASQFPILLFGFWSAVVIAAIMCALLATRLIMDKLTYGRPLQKQAASKVDVDTGAAPAGAGEPAKPGALPPIPLDTSPLAVSAGQTPSSAIAGSQTGASAPPAAPPRAIGPIHRLVGVGGTYSGISFELAPGEVRIGRQDADITLGNDSQVSRAHATLVVSADGIASIADQSSTNGTFLNDQRVQQATLAPGDMLRIGTTLFKVEG